MKKVIDKHVEILVKDVTDKGKKILQEIEIKSYNSHTQLLFQLFAYRWHAKMQRY